MKTLPNSGPILSPELFQDRRRNDSAGLMLPVAVMASLITGLIYLVV